MNALLRPLCWATRHHWQLRFEQPVTLYQENMLPRDELYHYECQRCGVWKQTTVTNLDNLPEMIELSGSKPQPLTTKGTNLSKLGGKE